MRNEAMIRSAGASVHRGRRCIVSLTQSSTATNLEALVASLVTQGAASISRRLGFGDTP